mmetsp:Transcript_42634/g.99985  ORF Transcript_42634/g.99985 Transcript_42634/m.99985 type:complete len:237 (+) Transcript_42634:1339-2049(+)
MSHGPPTLRRARHRHHRHGRKHCRNHARRRGAGTVRPSPSGGEHLHRPSLQPGGGVGPRRRKPKTGTGGRGQRRRAERNRYLGHREVRERGGRQRLTAHGGVRGCRQPTHPDPGAAGDGKDRGGHSDPQSLEPDVSGTTGAGHLGFQHRRGQSRGGVCRRRAEGGEAGEAGGRQAGALEVLCGSAQQLRGRTVAGSLGACLQRKTKTAEVCAGHLLYLYRQWRGYFGWHDFRSGAR